MLITILIAIAVQINHDVLLEYNNVLSLDNKHVLSSKI